MLGREALPVKTARIFKQYLLITAGCGMYALGFCWCCQPNYLNVGGFTGVAQVLNATFPVLPVGSVTLALNIPLFLLGWSRSPPQLPPSWGGRPWPVPFTPWPSAL